MRANCSDVPSSLFLRVCGCLPWAPLPIRQFLKDSHFWSTPACSDGHSPAWRVLPGDVFSEASLEGSSQHPSFHAVSRQCLCSDPTKGTFVPLTTCGLRLHGHGDDMQVFRLLQKRARALFSTLRTEGSSDHVPQGRHRAKAACVRKLPYRPYRLTPISSSPRKTL